LCVDGIQGAAAVVAVEVAAIKIQGLSSPVVWALAGAFAPRLIQGLRYRGGNRLSDIDLKDLFDRLSIPLEERIDATSAASKAASDHRLTKALMKKKVTPEVLAKELMAAMRARRALETKFKDFGYLQTLTEGDGSDEERLRILVAHAREIQLLATVRRLTRS
jgi:hypothetical protein